MITLLARAYSDTNDDNNNDDDDDNDYNATQSYFYKSKGYTVAISLCVHC